MSVKVWGHQDKDCPCVSSLAAVSTVFRAATAIFCLSAECHFGAAKTGLQLLIKVLRASDDFAFVTTTTQEAV